LIKPLQSKSPTIAFIINITVPLKEGTGTEHYFIDSVFVRVQVFSNKIASGNIGLANFKDVTVRKNPGDAEGKGIAYMVKCGELGKIFPDDPVELKNVEI
jgi:hypothetical protein